MIVVSDSLTTRCYNFGDYDLRLSWSKVDRRTRLQRTIFMSEEEALRAVLYTILRLPTRTLELDAVLHLPCEALHPVLHLP